MPSDSLETQRQELVGRLAGIRQEYERCVSDVPADVAYRGSEWSIVDLLRHVGGGYRGMVERILEEDNPNLGGGFDPDAIWKRSIDSMLSEIDTNITTVTGLTDSQLERSGHLGGNKVGLLDIFDRIANHYDEHLAQLRDEVRQRENLPRLT